MIIADIKPFYDWLNWLEKHGGCDEYSTLAFFEIRNELDGLLRLDGYVGAIEKMLDGYQETIVPMLFRALDIREEEGAE